MPLFWVIGRREISVAAIKIAGMRKLDAMANERQHASMARFDRCLRLEPRVKASAMVSEASKESTSPQSTRGAVPANFEGNPPEVGLALP